MKFSLKIREKIFDTIFLRFQCRMRVWSATCTRYKVSSVLGAKAFVHSIFVLVLINTQIVAIFSVQISLVFFNKLPKRNFCRSPDYNEPETMFSLSLSLVSPEIPQSYLHAVAIDEDLLTCFNCSRDPPPMLIVFVTKLKERGNVLLIKCLLLSSRLLLLLNVYIQCCYEMLSSNKTLQVFPHKANFVERERKNIRYSLTRCFRSYCSHVPTHFPKLSLKLSFIFTD